MTSRKPRVLRIGGATYFWRVYHRHLEGDDGGRRACEDVFVAFRDGHPRRGVRILFRATPEHGAGYPGQRGVVHDYRDGNVATNLNRPKVARFLVELATSLGWDPSRATREHVIVDGFDLLRAHRAALDATLGDDDGS